MGISVADNFNYQGSKFNFERDAFDTLAKMKAFPETSLPPKGFKCYCKETDKYYKFDSSNFVNEITGKWREDSNENSGYSKLTWDNSTNANNIKESGLYIIDGVHSNSGDNLPTTAYANGYIGGFMSVTVSIKDEELNEQIIGQNLTLSNKVSGETKQYIRSCIIKNEVETWSAWKEVNTIQMFGVKSSGIATKADIDTTIDNGQYAGVYMDADGFLPQGATFTLTVINNYAATAVSSLPAEYRQVTQMFIYTPLSTNGNVNKSVVCKRDGIGGSSITWGELESVGSNDNIILLGDITSINKDSSDENILNAIRVNPEDLINAALSKKIILAKHEGSVRSLYHVNIDIYLNDICFTILTGTSGYYEPMPNTLYFISVKYENNKWVSVSEIKTYIFEVMNFFGQAGSFRFTNRPIGFQMYDTKINKPIWHKGGNVWVDATGAEV